MLTNLQIVKRAAELTLSRKLLWLLGIFLSSGFNLHTWYGWQWLTQNRLYADLQTWLLNYNSSSAWGLVAIGVVSLILVINFLKLIFFGQVHNQLHDPRANVCLLCAQVKDRTVWQVVKGNLGLWLRVIIVSLFTVAATVGVISLFHFYSTHSDFNFVKAFLLMGSLIVVLVAISWWNMLTVLFMMWHELSLPKAAGLALDLLVSRLRRISSLTLLSTILFFISIVAGGSVLFQLPNFLASTPNFLFSGEVFDTWQLFVSVASGGLFLLWMVINNVWFNIVMVIMFDELARSQKSPEALTNPIFIARSQPSSLHHSVDKSPEMV